MTEGQLVLGADVDEAAGEVLAAVKVLDRDSEEMLEPTELVLAAAVDAHNPGSHRRDRAPSTSRSGN